MNESISANSLQPMIEMAAIQPDTTYVAPSKLVSVSGKTILISLILFVCTMIPMVVAIGYRKKMKNSIGEETEKFQKRRNIILYITNIASMVVLIIAVVMNLVSGNSFACIGLAVILYTEIKLLRFTIQKYRCEEELRFRYEEPIENTIMILPLSLIVICVVSLLISIVNIIGGGNLVRIRW